MNRPTAPPALAARAHAVTGDAAEAWWRHGVVYQVYPRSYQDTDGDGVGDLAGIAARLPYLSALGVAAVWLSPFYPSPMRDFGYDVSDYLGVDPLFGTLTEFDRLVAAAHAHGLRVILDYVPNHTSDRHPWFQESLASRSSPKRDWYVWRDPATDGGPPSNWLSEFGGSAWTRDPATGQYYYHAYLPEQPDLNWRNPDVRAAMLDVLRFWLDRGVDGFRVDAVHQLYEDEALRDNPPNPDWRPGLSPARSVLRDRTMDLPEVQDAVAAMRRVADAYGSASGSRVLIGEAYLPIPRMMAYYGGPGVSPGVSPGGGTGGNTWGGAAGQAPGGAPGNAADRPPGFHLPFNFHLLSTPWDAGRIAALVAEYEAALPPGAWPNWVLGNHDRSRVASRLGPLQARVAAMLLLTLRGTPTIYQGEEIGMQDVPIPPAAVQDPWERRVPGLGLGRDPVRTPMQWDTSPNAGFTAAGRPWLPLAADWQSRNVAVQEGEPRSMLALYRALLALRRAEPALHAGRYVPVPQPAPDVLAYERRDEAGGGCILVLLNLGSAVRDLPRDLGGELLLSTGLDRRGAEGDAPCLRANEGVILRRA